MGTEDEVTETPTTDEGTRARRISTPQLGRGDTRYTFRDELGRGGMGDVFAAHDTQLGREVAIKRPRSGEPNDRQIARFVREARIQGRLDHPAIVPVHELGYDARGLPYFAMKRLAGTTLSAVLRTPAPPRARLLRAFTEICLAVEFAHVRGVIHRDLKPDNIVLGDYGEVYVLDWGVAKVAGESDDFDDIKRDGLATQSGAAVGTPSFMAPEQARDASAVDARADVYALGRILAEILARDADPPPELAAVRDAAMVADPAQRTSSARALGDQIQGYLDGDRDLALRRKLAREHLEHARAAFAAGLDESGRGVALRAASSAMALDPTLRGAAELVGRLMLEPPRETPPEVARAMLADDTQWMFQQARGALRSTALGTVVVVPLLVLLGAPRAGLAYGAFAVANLVAMTVAMRQKPFVPAPLWAVALVNAIAIGMMAHIFSPMVVAPPAATLVAATLGANPFLRTRRAVVWLGLALFAGVVVPAIAEQVGLLEQTMGIEAGRMWIRGLIEPASWMLLPLLVVLAGTCVSAALILARLGATQERRAREAVHLQAWQLRQLVADPLAV